MSLLWIYWEVVDCETGNGRVLRGWKGGGGGVCVEECVGVWEG